jgi:hypothetical protein
LFVYLFVFLSFLLLFLLLMFQKVSLTIAVACFPVLEIQVSSVKQEMQLKKQLNKQLSYRLVKDKE